ncbi:tetratricopeptide repeat protein [Janthinobacterium fluminis]|uniref:Tetratricopeptide repeat protein n=1 Tax=Janthinobacterium fluminis TaxID=2987524 RepID=A0ABT5K7H8_9BURK|nr:tetratricopeptide repeat protein [Janthinobacterium fluminis]MDC8760390.1 tetratricopeptide repeat protein [Janthinobacterium fluminis]
MSLINKMLQDLDARGKPPGQPQTAVRPVPPPERAASWRLPMIGALALLAGGGAALGWHFLHRSAAPPAPVAAVVAPAIPAPAAPVQAAIPAPQPASPPSAALPPPIAAPAPEAVKQAGAAKPERVSAEKAPKPAPVARAEAPVTASAAPLPIQGKETSAQQRADNSYRRALGALQEGRVTESLAGLEQTLAIEPRHQGARETLIRLLLENKRQDDATRQMQLGLAQDPNQAAMAMMLARLQVEKGGGAVDTLMRTLPFASGNGEYRAFLAGVLQHDQRHREAVEQYELALRGAPQNGVWWMGLGISLLAEQRAGEAKEAFARAKSAPNMTPELLAFVERKLQQLAR